MFTDYSTICPESWSWEITPATFSYVNGTSAASQNPEVEFSEVGAYSVNLTVTNANGSNFLNKNNYIVAGGSSFPFFEDFEAGDAELNGWTVVNPDNDNTTWELFSVAGNGGTKAAGINLFNYVAVFKLDQLISPPIDLSGTSQAILTFDHAYALNSNPDWSDSLIVKISGDCGNSWTRILELGDDGTGIFATHPPSTMTFIPATADDWCGSGYGSSCLEADISAWAGMPNIKIMFESLRIKGNNLFIDNVSVNITTSITEETNISEEVNVFPNPSNGKIITELSNTITQGKMMIYNSNGSVVFESVLDNNQKRFSNDLSGLPKGMYIIRIIGLNFNASEKVMIK